MPVKKVRIKGKNGKDKDDRDWNEPITLPVEREAKNKIDAVNKYLQGDKVKNPITPKLWDDIISVLQGMLDDPADKFVEIDNKGNKVSVKREVNRIIGTFDKSGLEFYQQIVGPTAEQKYKQAEEENDMLLMAEVSTRYLHTKAGAAATIRIGTWHLDRGRYAQAAHTFRMFALRNPDDELPAPLLFKAALAYKRQAASDPTLRQGGRQVLGALRKGIQQRPSDDWQQDVRLCPVEVGVRQGSRRGTEDFPQGMGPVPARSVEQRHRLGRHAVPGAALHLPVHDARRRHFLRPAADEAGRSRQSGPRSRASRSSRIEFKRASN